MKSRNIFVFVLHIKLNVSVSRRTCSPSIWWKRWGAALHS